MYDALVIGAGFYGTALAEYLKARRGFGRVAIVEREADLFRRASTNNQARIHNGFHYPRSFTTAFRSRVNFPRFVRDYRDCVVADFTKIYAVARNNSRVTARQFVRFCKEIGANLEPLPEGLRPLFSRRLVEDAFVVEEYAFDAVRLAARAREVLAAHQVEQHFSTAVKGIYNEGAALTVACETPAGPARFRARFVFNCTYSGINQIQGDFPGTESVLRHEIAEIALVEVPAELRNLGITLVDGPFFSTMPYPARRLHSLSHVRYTPHAAWQDSCTVDPHELLRTYRGHSRVDRMLRDASRYVPALSGATYRDSLFEIKTVLARSESDDGRPIVFERHPGLPNCYSIVGGKIDNVYDVLESLDSSAELHGTTTAAALAGG